ncbi:MAG: electron transfer flavoprotein subunit alpha/FixB family protein [marine benthic group bacterium]|jgi:electron transfer flavoprotein alpha subunit|nr:electron transfer flavoprotein subunit alpha/FixB family protein [Gemmatimonadota bacterium]MCL7983105.1 electron transfer flavoprotein subunit alpha/FixB family protein [Gemmatimonadota bacterium]
MADVIAYLEMRDGTPRPVAREAVSAAKTLADRLGGSVVALAFGGTGTAEAARAMAAFGADRLVVVEDDSLVAYSPDVAVAVIQHLAAELSPAAVVFPASAQGKDLSARAAGRLKRSLASEVTELAVEDGMIVVTRPVYAGKAYARLRFRDSPALLSIRPNVFPVIEHAGAGAVERPAMPDVQEKTRVGPIEQGERDRLDVREADIVVSGGRGLQGPEKWEILEHLVDALGPGATLGASRAVVDAGWRPHGEQVGQTGKVVSPSLYFAIGISGAIQHLAGMRTANVIVAVNKDAEAPIFDVANYGIVGDAFEVVPELTDAVRKLRMSDG